MFKSVSAPLFSLFIALVTVLMVTPKLHAAQTLEQQVRPYGIKMQDLQTAFDTPEIADASVTLSQCKNSIVALSTLHYCIYKGQDATNYAVTVKGDMSYYKVLQSLDNGILVNGDANVVIMIEGKFDVIDGQQFSSKHYLLKRAGTFKYTNALGSTSKVLKLKLIKTLN